MFRRLIGSQSELRSALNRGRLRRDRCHRRGLHRPPVPIQHCGPVFLGLHLRLHRSQGHLHGVPAARARPVRVHSLDCCCRESRAVRGFLLHHSLSMYGGGSCRSFTLLIFLAPRMVGAIHGRSPDGVVGGGHPGSGARELHPRAPAQPGRPQGRRSTVSPLYLPWRVFWQWASYAVLWYGPWPNRTGYEQRSRSRRWMPPARPRPRREGGRLIPKVMTRTPFWQIGVGVARSRYSHRVGRVGHAARRPRPVRILRIRASAIISAVSA